MVAILGLSQNVNAAPAAPTFAKDVAPILYTKCVKCHRPGEVAPMSLIDYTNVRPWAKAIKQKVVSREMPPWFADRSIGKWSNDMSLTQDQIDTIVAWVDTGAPKGNDAEMPPVPQFAKGWYMGIEPDAIIQMPLDVPIPADGEIETRDYWTPPAFTEDKWISSVEFRPGNPEVVHHADSNTMPLCEGCRLDKGDLYGPDGSLWHDKNTPQEARKKIGTKGDAIFIYVPGHFTQKWPENTAKKLYANHMVNFNMHYQPSGKPTTDRSSWGFWWAKGPVKQQVFYGSGPTLPKPQFALTQLLDGKEISSGRNSGLQDLTHFSERPPIPPYADNYQMTLVRPVPVDITINGFKPHMHLRGKDATYIVTYPDGRQETILKIKYNFHWQVMYNPEKAIPVPAGSTLSTILSWDNSDKNPYNPQPWRAVPWDGGGTWNEGGGAQIQYTVDAEDLLKGVSASKIEDKDKKEKDEKELYKTQG
jgi:hypothetical protein